MHSRWVAFAKTGEARRLAAFAAGKEEWLDFTGDGAAAKQDLLKPRLDFVAALPPPRPPSN